MFKHDAYSSGHGRCIVYLQLSGGSVMSTLFDLSGLSPELRTEIESSPRWTKFFSAKPKALLGVDSNAKTVKGQALGFYTAILYLSPADLS